MLSNNCSTSNIVFFANSFTTRTGASALRPTASQAAYWSKIFSPITIKREDFHSSIEFNKHDLSIFCLSRALRNCIFLFSISSNSDPDNKSVEA